MQHKLPLINFSNYSNSVSAGSKSSVTFSLGLTAGNFIFTGLLAESIIKSAKSITSSNVPDVDSGREHRIGSTQQSLTYKSQALELQPLQLWKKKILPAKANADFMEL